MGESSCKRSNLDYCNCVFFFFFWHFYKWLELLAYTSKGEKFAGIFIMKNVIMDLEKCYKYLILFKKKEKKKSLQYSILKNDVSMFLYLKNLSFESTFSITTVG